MHVNLHLINNKNERHYLNLGKDICTKTTLFLKEILRHAIDTYTTVKMEDAFNITKNFLNYYNSTKRPASVSTSEDTTQEEAPADVPAGADAEPSKRARVEVIRIDTYTGSTATSSMQDNPCSYVPSEFSQDLFDNPPLMN